MAERLMIHEANVRRREVDHTEERGDETELILHCFRQEQMAQGHQARELAAPSSTGRCKRS